MLVISYSASVSFNRLRGKRKCKNSGWNNFVSTDTYVNSLVARIKRRRKQGMDCTKYSQIEKIMVY